MVYDNSNHGVKHYFMITRFDKFFSCVQARTTDAQRGNSLHCTAENSLPLSNF